MLKEAAGIAGGAVLLPTLGVSLVACGLPGLMVAGAGLFFANAVMTDIKANLEERQAKEAGQDSAEREDGGLFG